MRGRGRPGDVIRLRIEEEMTLLMAFVRLMERSERVAEKAMLGARRGGRSRAEVVRVFVVPDELRQTIRVVASLAMGDRGRAGEQAQQQKDCNKTSPLQLLKHVTD